MRLYCLVALFLVPSAIAANNITSIAPGDIVNAGDSIEIQWIELQGNTASIDLWAITDPIRTEGQVIDTVVEGTPNDGAYTWRIPDNIAQGGKYYFVLQVDDLSVTGTSSALFTILNPDTSLTVGPISSDFFASTSSTTTTSISTVDSSTSSAPSASGTASSSLSSSSGQSAVSGPSSTSSSTPTSATPTPTPTTIPAPSHLSTGAIIGIVLGVAGVLAFCIGIALAVLRRRRKKGTGGTKPRWRHGQPSHGSADPLSAHNLDQHLANEEWAGIRRDVPQKQTAYQNVTQSRHGGDGSARREGGNVLSQMSELRPDDAMGESRYGGASSAMYSDVPLTAAHPASESVWHPRI